MVEGEGESKEDDRPYQFCPWIKAMEPRIAVLKEGDIHGPSSSAIPSTVRDRVPSQLLKRTREEGTREALESPRSSANTRRVGPSATISPCLMTTVRDAKVSAIHIAWVMMT